MTRPEFDASICRLSMLPNAPDDADTHFAALSDLPAEVFEHACIHALRTRAWFPVPAELRHDADASAPTSRVATALIEPQFHAVVGGGFEVTIRNPLPECNNSITLKVDRVWKFDCEDCADSGWRSRQCPSEMACGRRFDHVAHKWVEPCACRD